MKKLLSILGTTTLTLTSVLGVVACSKGKSNKDDYFDSEINNIDPTIRNLVKYTSSIAKILISGRHENMNNYAFPTLQYFLNNVGNNLKGTFTTKSGKEVEIKKYVEEYKALNNISYNPWKATSTTYQPEWNIYNLMSTMVAMTDFSKWNTTKNQGRPTTKTDTTGRYEDFQVNQNLAWAQYDTGALANTLSQKSDSVLAYIQRIANWGGSYYDSSSQAYVSNILYHNSLSNPPTKEIMSYTDGKKEIQFGKAVANQSSALYDLFGLKYFDEAITMLMHFGPGLELPVLYSLAQLLPFAQNNRFGEKTAGIFLVAPFFILGQIREEFFDDSGNSKDASPLLEIFDRDTIDKTVLKVEKQSDGEVIEPNKQVDEMNLYGILNSPVIEKSIRGFGLGGEEQFLDLTNTTDKHTNTFLKWYAVLGNWFTAALTKEGSKFDVQKFNRIMTKTVYNGLLRFQGAIGLFAEDAVVALIRTLLQMLNAPNFDLFSLLKGISGLANWFYTSDSDGHYNLNINNVKTVENVYIEGKNKAGFKNNLAAVDINSEYAKFILDNYGFDKNTHKYKPGSLFDMIDIWSHGRNNTYPDHEAMHNFITQILDSQNGYIGDLTSQINTAMAQDWLDNIFLDRKWYITATETGVDGTKLGVVVTDGHITGVRYQLDYYGPKDASTKLGLHKKPLGYNDPVSGNSPSYVEQIKDANQRHNITPEGQTWSEQDWFDYDGMGNEYLANSEKIKYSYVVEFQNQARFLYNLGIKDDLTKNAYLLSDFSWYYNNVRYY
ncbi:lipoprotein [Spiroplasma endosymbiont of Polydrusus cervinus]|uniref:lipoprotein n=1 Tax=Spiroplasma endosymbiont of Polydrusus cervinus TaxID=3066287 RepID=UPI0030D555D4